METILFGQTQLWVNYEVSQAILMGSLWSWYETGSTRFWKKKIFAEEHVLAVVLFGDSSDHITFQTNLLADDVFQAAPGNLRRGG